MSTGISELILFPLQYSSFTTNIPSLSSDELFLNNFWIASSKL